MTPFILVFSIAIVVVLFLLAVFFVWTKSEYINDVEYNNMIQSDDEELLIKKLDENAIIPKRNNSNDAGLDLFSFDDIEIHPNEQKKISTKIAISLPKKTVGMICDRSSMGSKGIKVFGGIVDEPYRGEIIVVLGNNSKETIKIKKGDKIAQLLIIPILYSNVIEVNELSETTRGNQGFGSSGK